MVAGSDHVVMRDRVKTVEIHLQISEQDHDDRGGGDGDEDSLGSSVVKVVQSGICDLEVLGIGDEVFGVAGGVEQAIGGETLIDLGREYGRDGGGGDGVCELVRGSCG